MDGQDLKGMILVKFMGDAKVEDNNYIWCV